MTYNVNFGIPGDGPTLAAIELGKADVVFLQEINTGLGAGAARDGSRARIRTWRSTRAPARAASASCRACRSAASS